MQIQTAPGIPVKPLHLSSTDNEFNTQRSNNINPTLNSSKDATNSLPRRQHPLNHNKQSYQTNSQRSNGKTIYRSPRRPKAVLTIHHLYLYSSSSPGNLFANSNSNNHLNSSAGLGNGGEQKPFVQSSTSSQTQTNGVARTQATIPTYANDSHKTAPGTSINSTQTSRWNPGPYGIQHSSTKIESPGASDFQAMRGPNSPASSSTPSFCMNPTSPSSFTPSSQNRTKPTPNDSNDGNNSNNSDSVIAQLVEMGFDIADVKHVVDSSKDRTIQTYLDTLVQTQSTAAALDRHQHQHQQSQESSMSPSYYRQKKAAYESTSFAKPSISASPPLASNHDKSKTEPRYHTDDNSSDDEYLSNDAEWQRQQEARRRNYLETLRKQQEQQGPPKTSSYTKPTATTPSSPPQTYKYTKESFKPSPTAQQTSSTTTPPSSRPTSSSGAPITKPIDADTIKRAIKARSRGNDLFKLGYYGEAEKSYNQALALLPDRHDITAIVSNNRAAARLKNGQYRQCVMDCTFVIDWSRQKCINEGRTATIEMEDGGISIRWYDQLNKALHRKAEALEKMVRTLDAQIIYQELVNMDSGDTKAHSGLYRCQSTTERKPAPPPPTTTFSKPTSTYASSSSHTAPTRAPTHGNSASASASTTTAFPGLDYSIFEVKQPNINEASPSKAVAAMRARQAELAKEETERMEKADMVNTRIDAWKRGKEKNLRALLSSLDTLLWPGAQWRGAPINELLEPRKVKVCYMKAIAKVHPDKLPPSTTVEQRLLASGIFSVLNQAWDDFRSNNKI